MNLINLNELKNKKFIIDSISSQEMYPYDHVENYPLYESRTKFLLTLNGTGQIITEKGEIILLGTGSLVYFPAKSRYIFSEDAVFSYLDIFFDIIDFETKENLYLSDTPKLFYSKSPTEIFNTLLDFSNTSKYTSHEPQLIQISILHRLFYLMTRNNDFKLKENNDYSKIAESVKYMEHNFRNSLTCKDFASMCGFSETHFRRLFKKYIKTTPMQYNNIAKIKHACTLLRTSNNSIYNISNYLGYASTSDFCRVFKKIMGMSATEYRHKK